MTLQKTAVAAALAAGLASPCFAQTDEHSGRAQIVDDTYMGGNAQGGSEGGTVFDARRTSPRRRTLQASGTAIAVAIVAAAVASEYRGRR
jgi:hypothetical protein